MPSVTLVGHLSHSFPLIPYAAARKCMGVEFNRAIQEEGSKIPLLVKCAKRGHWGVFEHATMSFEVEASRACLDQLNRYRHSSICMESQRHVNMSERGYTLPGSIMDNPKALAVYDVACEAAKTSYATLIDLGIPIEDARNVIGMGVQTSEIISFNLAEFFHIRRQRLCNTAQKEIRDLVEKMSNVLLIDCPDLAMLYSFATPGCASCDIHCKGD